MNTTESERRTIIIDSMVVGHIKHILIEHIGRATIGKNDGRNGGAPIASTTEQGREGIWECLFVMQKRDECHALASDQAAN
ncbi:hypothetical protein [Bradyrhizobium erythrophlei]|uniref:hypothetical protein n=1 Tax=Bradyrhizobium erythrophlei TaxID=1437360 RepID=UPI000B884D5C|nr:hypothetical protein [Bradyrhizobium erythrophlei]